MTPENFPTQRQAAPVDILYLTRKFKDRHNRLLEYCFILLKRIKSIAVWCVNNSSAVSHNFTIPLLQLYLTISQFHSVSCISQFHNSTLSAVSRNFTIQTPSAASHNFTIPLRQLYLTISQFKLRQMYLTISQFHSVSCISQFRNSNSVRCISQFHNSTPSAISQNFTIPLRQLHLTNVTNLRPSKLMYFEQVRALPRTNYTLGSW
jgi:hypothetical protein